MIKCIPFIYKDIDDLCANTYILVDSKNECLVIDPSREYDGLFNFINKNKYRLKAILLTHGHFDHLRGAQKLLNSFNCKLYIGFDDEEFLLNSNLNLSSYCNENVVVKEKPITIADKEIIDEIEEKIEVIYTPYHTPGSVCYYLKDSAILFSGDSLFKMSVGRSDFPRSQPKLLDSSLRKIISLPENVKVYPGHGEFTNIGFEKKSNPFVKR